MSAISPFEVLAEELGAVAGRVERELGLRTTAAIETLHRHGAELEVWKVRMEQSLTERLGRLQDGRDGKDGVDGLPGENGAVGPPGPPGEAIQGPPGELPPVPPGTLEQIEKALTLLASPVVVKLDGERPKRKTISMRRDEQGNAVADVIEH
jgi:hypothetical protein